LLYRKTLCTLYAHYLNTIYKRERKDNDMYGFGHGWGMGFGWLVPLLIIGIIFYLIKGNDNRKSKKNDAQEILDKRFASGGISKEEYEEKSRLLKENS